MVLSFFWEGFYVWCLGGFVVVVLGWRFVFVFPFVLFFVFFLYRATVASFYGSLRAPFFVFLVYLVLFVVVRRFGGVFARVVFVAGLVHVCFCFSLVLRASFASVFVSLVPLLVLLFFVLVCFVVRLWPCVGASAVLDGFAVFAGLRVRLVVFFKLGGVGDVGVLLGEAWSRRLSFTVERLGGEVFVSVCFEGFSYGRVEGAAVEGAGWFEEVLRRGGFRPRRVEGWVEVERLLYAPLSPGWEALYFEPCVGGWSTVRLLPPLGRRGRAVAVRRAFKPGGLDPHPQFALKAFISGFQDSFEGWRVGAARD